MSVTIAWCCIPDQQIESAWINFLLDSLNPSHIFPGFFGSLDFHDQTPSFVYLIDSALLYLQKTPDQALISQLNVARDHD